MVSGLGPCSEIAFLLSEEGVFADACDLRCCLGQWRMLLPGSSCLSWSH